MRNGEYVKTVLTPSFAKLREIILKISSQPKSVFSTKIKVSGHLLRLCAIHQRKSANQEIQVQVSFFSPEEGGVRELKSKQKSVQGAAKGITRFCSIKVKKKRTKSVSKRQKWWTTGGVREWKSKQKCVQRSADRGCPPLPEFAKICQQKTEGKDKKWSIKDKM